MDLYPSDRYVGRLRELLMIVAADLPPAIAVSIEEMLDANETHEAVEVLVDALTDFCIDVDDTTAQAIGDLATLLDAEP
jgi:hypothetical protein